MSKSASISNKIRKVVIERAKGYCEYCLASGSLAFHTFPIDHIAPLSQGGTNSFLGFS